MGASPDWCHSNSKKASHHGYINNSLSWYTFMQHHRIFACPWEKEISHAFRRQHTGISEILKQYKTFLNLASLSFISYIEKLTSYDVKNDTFLFKKEQLFEESLKKSNISFYVKAFNWLFGISVSIFIEFCFRPNIISYSDF